MPSSRSKDYIRQITEDAEILFRVFCFCKWRNVRQISGSHEHDRAGEIPERAIAAGQRSVARLLLPTDRGSHLRAQPRRGFRPGAQSQYRQQNWRNGDGGSAILAQGVSALSRRPGTADGAEFSAFRFVHSGCERYSKPKPGPFAGYLDGNRRIIFIHAQGEDVRGLRRLGSGAIGGRNETKGVADVSSYR